MQVTQYYPIGSITVPSSWVACIIGFLITYLIIRLSFGKVHGERFGNLFFNVIIIWKLSVVLTDFSTVLHYPLSIIYFHGGTVGWLLALAIAGMLIRKQAVREKWQRLDQWVMLLSLLSWQTVYQIMMALLNEGSVVAKSSTILLFVLLLILAFWSYRKKVHTVSELAVIAVAVHFTAAALQPAGLLQVAFLTTIFIGLLMWGMERLVVKSISRKEEVQ